MSQIKIVLLSNFQEGKETIIVGDFTVEILNIAIL